MSGDNPRVPSDLYFNPWDEAYRANPYPHYKPLYGRAPVLMDLFVPIALIARYADAAAILRDHQRFSSQRMRGNVAFEPQEDLFGGADTVLLSDPPAHTRLRRLVSRAFTPRRLKDLEPKIHEFTESLINKAMAQDHFDVIEDLAAPLPVMVISHMLGVPHDHYAQFKYWSDRIVERRNALPGTPIPEESRRAIGDLRSYLSGEIEKRRTVPTDDLIGVLVAHEEAEALTSEELEAFVVLLLIAGNETTTNLIGNGMLALARNPGQFEMLREERAMLPRAIEEMLRYDGPVQSTGRRPLEEVEIGGTMLKPGTIVLVMIAAANRDPEQFPNPDSFDISRTPNDHLAFGEGIHYCLGAALARMEGAIAFDMMLSRFRNLHLENPDADMKYKGSYFLRGLAHLPIKFNR